MRYANRNDFKNFISTFDPSYVSADGFNLDTYSKLVQDIWSSYKNIKYDIEIKDIKVQDNRAVAQLEESAYAKINFSPAYEGKLRSESETLYNLEKINGSWKVVSDNVLEETTSMLYGEAQDLDIRLTVPNNIPANSEYSAILEFTPPDETIAIASLASDKVEYPQKPTKEVFRAVPEDNILERLFTANNDNSNEYIVASIGITKTAVSDLSVKMSLTGFGYAIKRVNIISNKKSGEEI